MGILDIYLRKLCVITSHGPHLFFEEIIHNETIAYRKIKNIEVTKLAHITVCLRTTSITPWSIRLTLPIYIVNI